MWQIRQRTCFWGINEFMGQNMWQIISFLKSQYLYQLLSLQWNCRVSNLLVNNYIQKTLENALETVTCSSLGIPLHFPVSQTSTCLFVTMQKYQKYLYHIKLSFERGTILFKHSFYGIVFSADLHVLLLEDLLILLQRQDDKLVLKCLSTTVSAGYQDVKVTWLSRSTQDYCWAA